MLGDVVKLFLCRSCKGLFILDSQIEKHVDHCDGDSFKSPANLFACEREYFLELVAPTADEKTRASQRNHKKRKKASSEAKYEPEKRSTNRSTLKKHGSVSPSSNSSFEVETTQLWETPSSFLSVSPHSCSQPLPQPQISPVQSYSPGETMISAFRGPESALKRFASLQSTIYQQPCVTSTATSATAASACWPQEEADTARSSNSLLEERRRKRTCSESDLQAIQNSNTPAVELLTYLSKLQQGEESCRSQLGDQPEQSTSFDHSSFASDGTEFSVGKDQQFDETNASDVSVNVTLNDSSLAEQQLDQVQVVDKNVVETGGFQFRAVATISAPHSREKMYPRSKDEDETIEKCVTGSEVLPFFPDDAQSLCKKGLGIADTPGTSTANTSETLCLSQSVLLEDDAINLSSVQLQENVDQIAVTVSSVMPHQTVSKSPQSGLFCVEMDGDSVDPGSQVFKTEKEDGVQGSVVYILEPNGLLMPMSVEDVLNEDSGINTSFSLATSISSDNPGESSQVSGTDSFVVCDAPGTTLTLNSVTAESVNTDDSMTPHVFSAGPSEAVYSAGPSEAVYSAGPSEAVYSTGPSEAVYSAGPSEAAPRAKPKSQIRQEELSALRDECLLQSTEIPPSGDSKKTSYCCNHCGYMAKSVKVMHKHLKKHSDNAVYYECDQCEFKSQRHCRLVEHQLRHSRSRHLCHLCPATFMDIASLNRHVTAKHTESEFLKCDQCGFAASQASDLKEHKLRHTGELLCCAVEGCEYKTPYQRALRSHQKRHAGEKNYACSLCDYRSVDKSTLVRHMKSHTQERPYHCSSCHFKSNTRHGLLFHMQHVHGPQKSVYLCDRCPFRTVYATSMAKHLQSHQGGFTCPLCQHVSRTVGGVKRHVQQVHHLQDIQVVDSNGGAGTKVNVRDYLVAAEDAPPLPPAPAVPKPLMAQLLTDALGVGHASQELPSLSHMERSSRIDPMVAMERSRSIDPMVDLDRSRIDTMVEMDRLDRSRIDTMVDMERPRSSGSMDPMSDMDRSRLDSMSDMDRSRLDPMSDMERSRIDPMKLSFHFGQDASGVQGLGPFMPSGGTSTNLTRSSSIPDLFTFSGMNRSNSQTDLFTFSGISAMTRSNSMSDLVSFATSMCADGSEPVNMDVSLSDATLAPPMDVGGLSLGDGDGSEVSSLNGVVGVGVGGPGSSLVGGGGGGGVVLALQCSKCFRLLVNEMGVDDHSKVCSGTVQMV